MTANMELRHGYTLADINRLSRVATRTAGTHAADHADLVSWAWSAIVEHLYLAEYWPPEHRLIQAGKTAIWASVRSDQRWHGGARQAHYEPGTMAAYQRYWWGYTAVTPSHEEPVVERLALRQVLPLLTAREHQALLAVAAHDGDVEAAAISMGLTLGAIKNRLQAARKRIFAAWHEGTVPPRRVWRTAGTTRARIVADPERLGGHCHRGHLFDQANTYVKASGKRECRRCIADAAGRRRRRVSADVAP